MKPRVQYMQNSYGQGFYRKLYTFWPDGEQKWTGWKTWPGMGL